MRVRVVILHPSPHLAQTMIRSNLRSELKWLSVPVTWVSRELDLGPNMFSTL